MKGKKSFSCSLCGAQNDHYFSSCPISSDEEDEKPSTRTLWREFNDIQEKSSRIGRRKRTLAEDRSPRLKKVPKHLDESSNDDMRDKVMKIEREPAPSQREARALERKMFTREQERLRKEINRNLEKAKNGQWSRSIFYSIIEKEIQESDLNPSHEELDCWKLYGRQLATSIRHMVSTTIMTHM